MLGQRVHVACADASIAAMVRARYGAMAVPSGKANAHSRDVVAAAAVSDAIAVHDADHLSHQLDHDIVIALQRMRPDLLFLHAAALEFGGTAYLLAGESGHGKSTTAWGLLHHGFRYLSDELSPLDAGALQVLAFPRAICLKQTPPSGYPIPAGHVDAGDGLFHIPVGALPGGTAAKPCRLGAVLFVRHRPDMPAPELRPIGRAEACARLYTNTLNALAHGNHGFDVVADIAARVPCYSLSATDLRTTCELICRSVAELHAAPRVG